MADLHSKTMRTMVNGSTNSNNTKKKDVSAEKKNFDSEKKDLGSEKEERADKLTEKFVQLRQEALKKGLSEREIRESFLRPCTSSSFKRLLSSKTFQTQVNPRSIVVSESVLFCFKCIYYCLFGCTCVCVRVLVPRYEPSTYHPN